MNDERFGYFFGGLWTWTMNAYFENMNAMNGFIFSPNNERNERFFGEHFLNERFCGNIFSNICFLIPHIKSYKEEKGSK